MSHGSRYTSTCLNLFLNQTSGSYPSARTKPKTGYQYIGPLFAVRRSPRKIGVGDWPPGRTWPQAPSTRQHAAWGHSMTTTNSWQSLQYGLPVKVGQA